MARKKGRHRKGGRVTPKGTRPEGFTPRRHDGDGAGGAGRAPREPDLMGDVRRALADPSPLEFLAMASSLLSALDPRSRDPFTRARSGDADEAHRRQILDSFVEVDRPETTALLAAFAELSPDELERRRIRRVLRGRTHPLPDWLAQLDDAVAEPDEVNELTHVLGDGDDVNLSVRLADGSPLTAVVYIDHNMGTVVKDAFVVADSMADTVRLMRRAMPEGESTIAPLDPADAKARVLDAIEHGSIVYPPLETDTWPACRPLVEWMVRLLPDGGRGYERPEWSEADREALTERFFASEAGAPLDDADHRGLFESLLWFGCDYGPGDPLRWSPVSVEIVLTDWLPRKVVAPATYLAEAPDLLRAFIRFAHAERAIPAHLTADTLDAVDEWEPEYQAVIRTDRPQGPEAILARMGVLGDGGVGEPWGDAGGWGSEDWDSADWDVDPEFPLARSATVMLDLLASDVGGVDVLESLDTVPLPDEPFSWDGVDDDVRERVTEVLELVDRCCDDLLDVEHRTACRRLLARIARLGPEVFRRRGRAETAAGAVCWLVCRANGTFDSYGRGLKVGDLADRFDTSSSNLSSRASTLLKAGRFEQLPYGYGLGSPDFLVSAARRQIADRRDRWKEELPGAR